MNKLIFQYWEESTKNCGPHPDGASLHVDLSSYKKYINNIYKRRKYKSVPNKYSRIIGNSFEVFVDDDIYNLVSKKRSLRVLQHQLNNLIKLKNIKINE